MGRREQREHIFKLLFRVEFNDKEEMPAQLEYFFHDEEDPISEKDEKYISDKYNRIMDHLSEIDDLLNEKADKWSTKRMGKVELTILRLAVYEIRMDDQIPTSVAINEAVELAKKFGQDESKSFVNGILAKFAEKEDKREESSTNAKEKNAEEAKDTEVAEDAEEVKDASTTTIS